MDSLKEKTIVVTGATGRQGSAVVRHLLQEEAHVKALTRSPQSQKQQSSMSERPVTKSPGRRSEKM